MLGDGCCWYRDVVTGFFSELDAYDVSWVVLSHEWFFDRDPELLDVAGAFDGYAVMPG